MSSRTGTKTQSQTRHLSPVRSIRRRSQITESSLNSSARADRSAFTCLPKHQLSSVKRSAKPNPHIPPPPLISYTEDESLYKQWSFPCPRKKDRLHVPVPDGEQQKGEDQKPVLKESQRVNWLYVKYIAAFTTLILASGFLGGFCYAYIDYYYLQDSKCTFQHSTDVTIRDDRFSHLDLKIQGMRSSMTQLKEEFKVLRGEIAKPPEIVPEVITIPTRGILEELFTSEPDLASAGNRGSVLSTPDTTTLSNIEVASLPFLGWLSFNIHQPHRPPQTTIQGLIQEIGDCWAFTGQQGRLVLSLIRPSLLASVSVSHIPPNMSPAGDIYSAPKHFQVVAHQSEENLDNGIILGKFEYKKAGPWRQTFNLNNLAEEEMFEIIEFRFLSNHGHPNYTCVYRVHVHGKMLFT